MVDKLCSDRISSAAASEFNVNELTKQTQNKVIYCSVDENFVTRGSQEPNLYFPYEQSTFQYLLISVFAATLQNKTIMDKNRLHLCI